MQAFTFRLTLTSTNTRGILSISYRDFINNPDNNNNDSKDDAPILLSYMIVQMIACIWVDLCKSYVSVVIYQWFTYCSLTYILYNGVASCQCLRRFLWCVAMWCLSGTSICQEGPTHTTSLIFSCHVRLLPLSKGMNAGTSWDIFLAFYSKFFTIIYSFPLV